MKGRRLAIMVVCAILAWAVVPAWGEEGNTQATATTAPAEQKAVEPPAVQPAAQPTAPPAAQPVTEQKPAPADAQPAPQSGTQIKDAMVCQDVVDRAPVGGGDVFTKDIAKVYCYCRVLGMEGEGSITHNWYYKGTLKTSIKLPVRAASWRTWSGKTMSPDMAGEWMVEILSEKGTPLESIIFFIQ